MKNIKRVNLVNKLLSLNPFGVTKKDGRLLFPGQYWFFERVKASIVNRRWITEDMFDEIRRGN